MTQKQIEAEAFNRLFSIRWKYYDSMGNNPEAWSNLLNDVRNVVSDYTGTKSINTIWAFAISIIDDIDRQVKPK